MYYPLLKRMIHFSNVVLVIMSSWYNRKSEELNRMIARTNDLNR